MVSVGDDRLISEALRLNDRYLAEVVVAFGLCPWAEHAILSGQVRRRVVTDSEPRLEAILSFVDEIEAPEAAPVEIGLVILTRFAGSAAAFDRFAERLRQADRTRRGSGILPAFVAAAFHPDAPAEFSNPWQMVAAIRRSPDPTIQFVRDATLGVARRSAPRVGDEIARRNFDVVSADPGRLERAIADIRRDRDESYARLATAGILTR